MLQDYVQRDVKIAELEAELARYREYFEQLHLLFSSRNTKLRTGQVYVTPLKMTVKKVGHCLGLP